MTTYPINSHPDIIRQNADVVILRGVSKKYPNVKGAKSAVRGLADFWALKNINLFIRAGEILGIIGRNGAGKTTLLNIIAGVLSPTSGQIDMEGRVLGLFNLGVGFQDELTGRENIFLNGAILGATRLELEGRISAIIDFSELGDFIDMPLGTYSQGMRLRLGFSILVNLDFDILVIDEVLAVGDALFQNKCFERLMDFRREGKTLVIVSQSVELVERLCDRIVLLDHGRVLFDGNTNEATNKYRSLLNTETFFVGSRPRRVCLVENTKKWAEDVSNWGTDFGTKEVVIENVVYSNRFGLECGRVKSGQRLKIRVSFKAKNDIKEPHFGIALFRNDGVYCYGPNTKFDGCHIGEIKKGRGYFILDIQKLMLAPGEYRVSLAIWDKNETLAYVYQEGYYELTVKGDSNGQKALLNMPYRCSLRRYAEKINIGELNDKWGKKIDPGILPIKSVKFLDEAGKEKDVFVTNEGMTLIITFDNNVPVKKNMLFWAGLFRDDGIYCQGVTCAMTDNRDLKIEFPKLSLLPGNYRVSLGAWDKSTCACMMSCHGVYPFRMVFDKEDHGTVYLEHKWRWQLPRGGVG